MATAVAAPYQCGFAGYGGHLTVAPIAGPVRVIDFNTAASSTATKDLFPLAADGSVKGNLNTYGWHASGVPGTLAGLELGLKRFGSLPLSDLLQPAIQYADQGFVVEKWFAKVIERSAPQLARDPASARLYLPEGKPLAEGQRLKNPDAARVLRTFAARGTFDSFYRGDIAGLIAENFKAHGGIVTADDLAAYRAREIDPLTFTWRNHTLCTAPLPAGGTTVFEFLSLLRAMGALVELQSPRGTHAWVEALRVAWQDRLGLFGDPKNVDVPIQHLLSPEYASRTAARIRPAVEQRRQLNLRIPAREQDGTIHISAVDRAGNLVALTLTHGAAFGAHVTLDGLGLLLGAGMSRFNPHPDHPNAPGPGKRPLHNMCPTIVQRDGRAVLAIDGAGGRRIPSAVAAVLWHALARDLPLDEALQKLRVHVESDQEVWFDGPEVEGADDYLTDMRYQIVRRKVALVSAASFDPQSGQMAAGSA